MSAPAPTTDLPLALARARLLQLCVPFQPSSERLPLRAALGRVLAADVRAGFDTPPHDNAAMDGYALDSATFVAGHALRVVGRALAGHPYPDPVDSGCCVRIMTGAPLPAGCDCVVQQELCQLADAQVSIETDAVFPGRNVRRRGDDQRAGAVALAAGHVLRAADIGLLASLGCAEIDVRLPLRVAIFSSGDELRSPGQPLRDGEVYDCNRDLLWALLDRLGCQVIDLGRVADDPAAMRAALQRGCAEADVVLSTGGVSVGDADYLKSVMAELGELASWRIAMRPGRPLAFGRIGSGVRQIPLIGLPGNPAAVAITFLVLVRDALLQMMGAAPRPLHASRVVALHDIAKKSGRTELPRARLQRLADGRCGADCRANQGAGGLGSLSAADGLLLLEHERGPVHAGDIVEFLPFAGLLG